MEKQNGHVSRERGGGGRGAAGSVVQAPLRAGAAESRHGQTAWAGVQLGRGLRPTMGPGWWATLAKEVPELGALLRIARPFLLAIHLGGNRLPLWGSSRPRPEPKGSLSWGWGGFPAEARAGGASLTDKPEGPCFPAGICTGTRGCGRVGGRMLVCVLSPTASLQGSDLRAPSPYCQGPDRSPHPACTVLVQVRRTCQTASEHVSPGSFCTSLPTPSSRPHRHFVFLLWVGKQQPDLQTLFLWKLLPGLAVGLCSVQRAPPSGDLTAGPWDCVGNAHEM